MNDPPDKRSRRALQRRPEPPDYEVGYRKPPEANRFRPGQSGNPKGRPRGAKAKPHAPALNEERLKSIVIEEAYRLVTVSDPRGEVTIPMAQAVIRSLAVSAAKGNARAQRLFTELLSATETDNRRLHDEWLNTAIDYKVSWEQELDRRRRPGILAEDPIPHPDDIIIDVRQGTVRTIGPMTREEKVMWDDWRARKREAEASIAGYRADLAANPDHPHRDLILEDIVLEQKVHAILSKVVKD